MDTHVHKVQKKCSSTGGQVVVNKEINGCSDAIYWHYCEYWTWTCWGMSLQHVTKT